MGFTCNKQIGSGFDVFKIITVFLVVLSCKVETHNETYEIKYIVHCHECSVGYETDDELRKDDAEGRIRGIWEKTFHMTDDQEFRLNAQNLEQKC